MDPHLLNLVGNRSSPGSQCSWTHQDLNKRGVLRKWQKLGSVLGRMGGRLGQAGEGSCVAQKGVWREDPRRSSRRDLNKDVF